jgi:hypothetical protein
MTIGPSANPKVEVEEIETETVKVRVLPDGRMDRNNAAKYLNRAPKTLAIWASEGKGPPMHKLGGRCFYYKSDLYAEIQGEAAV